MGLIGFFYRIRHGLMMMVSIAALDASLAHITLTAVQPVLEDEPPAFVVKKKRPKAVVRRTPLSEYRDSLVGSVLFPGQAQVVSASDGGPAPVVENLPDFQSLKFELIGTVTGPKWFSRAYIKVLGSKDPATKSGRAYKIGNRIEKARLIWIGRKKVALLYNGRKQYLYSDPDMKPKTTGKAASKPGPAAAGSGQRIEKVMTRSDLNRQVFGNLNNIMKGIAIGPNFTKGKMDGYKIKRIRSSNVLYSLGARSGDIIRSVNGHKIDDIKKVLAIWERVKNEKNIDVDIERNGSIITYHFDIKD